MKTTGAWALAVLLAASGASLAQTGGASGGASSSSGGASSSGAGAGAIGAAPGTTSGGPSLGGGVSTSTTATTTNAPAAGGVPSTPGALNNQLQSNQNQQTGTNTRNAGPQMQPSTLGTGGNPSVSGSGRDAAARASNAAQCETILAHRNEHKPEQVAACERSTANDPAAALDRRLQRENSRAVNSICRGC